MDLQNLITFLQQSAIPLVKKKPLTFLEISRQPHYENVWSNIYAFFLNIEEEHNLQDLFVHSLVQLINQKSDLKFKFSFDVFTEFSTNKNGRIDILLQNEDDAIIIENKVFHHLNNDLDDYWSSIKQSNKIGVILSIHKINSIDHENFINITHLDFFEQIIGNLSNYIEDVNDKYVIFLKDFHQNIINQSNSMDKNIIDFFNSNRNKINQILNIRNNYIKYIIDEVEKARENVDEDLDKYAGRNENHRYYTCPNQNNLMITVVFGDLLNEKNALYLVVEIQNELLSEIEKIKTITFTEEENKLLKKDFFQQKERWAHFAVHVISPTELDIYNLSDYISKTINESPILSIYRKLKQTFIDIIN